MFNSPFRKEALANRNQRQQLDHLLRVTAPHERIILASIGVALLALAAWALFGRMPTGVTVDGVLIESGVRHEVASLEPGRLLEYLVDTGDRVEAGSPIARQSVPELDREITALLERIDLLQSDTGLAGAGSTGSTLDSARESILQMEARRAVREVLVSQTGGEVAALWAAPGQFLSVGTAVAQIRDGEPEPLKAVIRVAPRVAQRIEAGMRASVEIVMPGEATRVMNGEVALMTEESPGDWIDSLLPLTGNSSHLVEVVLDQAWDNPVSDGSECRVRIEFGHFSPAALFNFVRS